MVIASVPSYFTCPITLELMNDPVTLSTGQTYDRRSIEKWFDAGHNTCPSTMQVISSNDIAPNHTLQRLIQHWVAANDYYSNCCGGGLVVVDKPLFPKGVMSRSSSTCTTMSTSTNQGAELKQVQGMLQGIAQGTTEALPNLKTLRSLAKESSERSENRKVLQEAGAIPILANFVFSPENLGKDLEACEEALGVLTLLPRLHKIRSVVHVGTKQLTAISWVLNRGSLDGRVAAALFLAGLAGNDTEMKESVGATAGVFEGLVQLLKENLHARAMSAGLKTVLAIVSDGPERSTVRAVKAGMVFAVAELLPEAEKVSKVRSLTTLLEILCSCTEGQRALSAHPLIVPVLVRIMSLRDDVASEKAVSCLWTVCQCSPKECVDEAAGQAGILSQLSQLSQADDSRISREAKQRATFLLSQLRYRLQKCNSRS